MAGIQLIVGLGNPGPQYMDTRHNVGAWFVDILADLSNVSFRNESKFFGFVARIETFSQPLWLLKPTTFMNESGRSIAALAKFYKIPVEAILVAHDELDFPAGVIRFKEGGGHGGHNGLRSAIQVLQDDKFSRLRIGIDHPGHRDQVSPYVLSAPSKKDEEKIIAALEEGIKIIPSLVAGDKQKVFRELHQ